MKHEGKFKFIRHGEILGEIEGSLEIEMDSDRGDSEEPVTSCEVHGQLSFPFLEMIQDANENPIFEQEIPKEPAPKGFVRKGARIEFEYFVPEEISWGDKEEDFVAMQAAEFTSRVIEQVIARKNFIRQNPSANQTDPNIN